MARLDKKEFNKIKKKGGLRSKSGNKGYVYILTNPSLKGKVKIGMTQKSVAERVKQLNSATGVPTPFNVYHFVESNDCKKLEGDVHKMLSKSRTNSRREFFDMSPKKAKKIVEKHNKVINGTKSGGGFFWKTTIFFLMVIAGLYFYATAYPEHANSLIDELFLLIESHQ